MVCMFSLGWSVPPIVYKLHSLHDLPEMPWLKPFMWLKKNSTVLTINHGFWFQFGNRHSTTCYYLLGIK